MSVQHRLMVLDPDPDRRSLLAHELAGPERLVEPVSGPETLESAPPDLLVSDYDLLTHLQRERVLGWMRSAPARKVVLLSSGKARQDLALLLGSGHLRNLIGCSGQRVDLRELRITVQKLLDPGVLFGLDKYFPPEVRGEDPILVHDSREIPGLVERASAFGQGHRVHQRLIALFCTAVEELVTNSLYHAPVDAAGKSRHGHRPRTEPVVLESGEQVTVSFAWDAVRLGVSVTDDFGSLNLDKVVETLTRCFRKGLDQFQQKASGAGLGLFLVSESVSQLVVNLSPGKRTEVIGLVDVSGTYRDFAGKAKSLNLFSELERA